MINLLNLRQNQQGASSDMLKGNFYVLFFIFCLLQISCNNYAPKEDIILTDTLNRDDFSIDSIKITDSLTMILWDNLTIHNK